MGLNYPEHALLVYWDLVFKKVVPRSWDATEEEDKQRDKNEVFHASGHLWRLPRNAKRSWRGRFGNSWSSLKLRRSTTATKGHDKLSRVGSKY